MRVSSPLAARSLDYIRARNIVIIYHLQHWCYPVEKGCFNNNNYYNHNSNNNDNNASQISHYRRRNPSLPG